MELQVVQNKIVNIRGIKVMLDFDLAQLYEVETKALNQAVKRNSIRFPIDFMFKLTPEECELMRSHNVTASQNKRNISNTPYAFTEQGVAMLSSVLKPLRAMRLTQRLPRYVCHAVSVPSIVMQMLYSMTNETQVKPKQSKR